MFKVQGSGFRVFYESKITQRSDLVALGSADADVGSVDLPPDLPFLHLIPHTHLVLPFTDRFFKLRGFSLRYF